MFDEVLKNYYIIPIFSTLIITITFGINNWDMTDIEKKLVTRFKRLQIELSLMLIETVMIGICLSITLNRKMLEPLDLRQVFRHTLLKFFSGATSRMDCSTSQVARQSEKSL